jgi:hypothetical protein
LYSPSSTQAGGVEELDWVSLQVWWTLGPFLVMAGVLTVAGVLFFIAWWWVKRERPENEHEAR